MNMNDFNLDKAPKITTGFVTPVDYYELFSEKILLQLPSQPQPKVIPLWKRSKKWLSAVAAVVVLSISLPVINYFKTESNGIYASEMENYLTHYSTLSDDDILESMSVKEIENVHINSTLQSSDLEAAVLSENANLEEYITN